MRTGFVDSWATTPSDVGPMYPFVGWEFPLLVICLMLWIGFTLWQMKFEDSTYAEECEALNAGDQLSKTVEESEGDR